MLLCFLKLLNCTLTFSSVDPQKKSMRFIQGTVLDHVSRDTMDYDVLVVGGGPSGLAAALHLKQQQKIMGREISVCLVDKAASPGGHILSGAVIDPTSLDQLLPDWRTQGAPLAKTPVSGERFLYMTQKKAFPIPHFLLPPMMHNKGYYVGSLGALCRWLTERAEKEGIDIFSATAAAAMIHDKHGQCTGIVTGDMGVNKKEEKKRNYTPGVIIKARYTILAEGARGSLTKHVTKHYQLRKHHQTYALGLKEVWEISKKNHRPGFVQHMLGWPLDKNSHGGGFLYHWGENLVSVGLVVHLDYKDPTLSPFEEFQRMKHHPALARILVGGKRISYGARTIAAGGLQSLPKLIFPGGLLVGCCAGLVNVPRIKGTHNAIATGMMAARAVAKALMQKEPPSLLHDYQLAFRHSSTHKELYRVRNVKPLVSRFGNVWGTILSGAELWLRTVGLGWPSTLKILIADRQRTELLSSSLCSHRSYRKPDGVLSFDRTSSVYLSGTTHQDDEPVHLHLNDPSIPIDVNLPRYGEPACLYCPAGVYEIVPDGAQKRFQINAQNCVHCKACDIKDPSSNINWVVPEGGGRP